MSLLAAASVSFVLAQAGTADICRTPQPPVINVVPKAEQLQIDNTRSIKELGEFQISSVSPFGNKQTQVHGLMQGPVDITSEVSISWRINETTDQACFWYDRIDVTLTLEPVVYIEKNTKPGTCRYRAVYNHELKHVNTDRQIVNEYSAVFKKHIQDFVQQRPIYGPFPTNTTQDIQQHMGDALRYSFENLKSQMEADRLSRQLAIDTIDEYRRVASECDDDVEVKQRDVQRSRNNYLEGLY